MKFKTLMMSFVLSICTVAVFAASASSDNREPLPFKKALQQSEYSVIVSKPVTNTCTVTVAFGKITSTFTATCECTLRDACNAAYKMATILVKA
jgi:hypothetical protein